MATRSPSYRCVRAGSAIAMGALLEPLAHPKLGGVTRVVSQPDKDVFSFAVHHEAVERAVIEACASAEGGGEDPVADGLEEYSRALDELSIRTNVGLGQALLLIPLGAAAVNANGSDELRLRASWLTARSTPRATEEYYALLSRLRPSHLGRYWGPLGDVGEGPPRLGLGEVLSLLDDIVSQEAVNGYRLSAVARDLVLAAGSAEEGINAAVVRLASTVPDTLIARSRGLRASLIGLAEVRLSRGASAQLATRWAGRGWSPGSILDVVSAGVSLAKFDAIAKGSLRGRTDVSTG